MASSSCQGQGLVYDFIPCAAGPSGRGRLCGCGRALPDALPARVKNACGHGGRRAGRGPAAVKACCLNRSCWL
jgi:hypothetical protein